MTILGLDPGLTLGWAIGRPRQITAAGAKRFGRLRQDMAGPERQAVCVEACRQFGAWLQPQHLDGIAKILVEEPAVGGRVDAHLQRMSDWMYLTVLLTAETAGVEVVTVHTGTLKKRATGHGRAPKRQTGRRRSMDAMMVDAAQTFDPAAGRMTDHEATARLLIEHFGDPNVLTLVA